MLESVSYTERHDDHDIAEVVGGKMPTICYQTHVFNAKKTDEQYLIGVT